jgi:hypothetical protein
VYQQRRMISARNRVFPPTPAPRNAEISVR